MFILQTHIKVVKMSPFDAKFILDSQEHVAVDL